MVGVKLGDTIQQVIPGFTLVTGPAHKEADHLFPLIKGPGAHGLVTGFAEETGNHVLRGLEADGPLRQLGQVRIGRLLRLKVGLDRLGHVGETEVSPGSVLDTQVEETLVAQGHVQRVLADHAGIGPVQTGRAKAVEAVNEGQVVLEPVAAHERIRLPLELDGNESALAVTEGTGGDDIEGDAVKGIIHGLPDTRILNDRVGVLEDMQGQLLVIAHKRLPAGNRRAPGGDGVAGNGPVQTGVRERDGGHDGFQPVPAGGEGDDFVVTEDVVGHMRISYRVHGPPEWQPLNRAKGQMRLVSNTKWEISCQRYPRARIGKVP